MFRVLLLLLAASFILIYLAWPTPDNKRIALVLGNSNYTNSPYIGVSANNARKMGRSLRRLGFDVIEGTNLNRSEILSSFQMFAARMKGADVALLYYSGYVHQENGRTYVTPIEANPSNSHQLEFQTVELRSLLIHMANSTHSNLILFDACRTNLASTSESVLIGKCQPLKRIPIQKRMIISYPTKSSVALSNMQRGKSVFTKSFLEYADREIANSKQALLHNVMLAVQRVVAARTQSKQLPWVEFSPESDSSLNLASARAIENTQFTLIRNAPTKKDRDVQSNQAASNSSERVLPTSKTDLTLSAVPTLKPDDKIDQTKLSAIAPDEQLEKRLKRKQKKRKVGTHNKRKFSKRVTRRSWQKRKLLQMLDQD